jgi:hypothetical protein
MHRIPRNMVQTYNNNNNNNNNNNINNNNNNFPLTRYSVFYKPRTTPKTPRPTILLLLCVYSLPRESVTDPLPINGVGRTSRHTDSKVFPYAFFSFIENMERKLTISVKTLDTLRHIRMAWTMFALGTNWTLARYITVGYWIPNNNGIRPSCRAGFDEIDNSSWVP